MEDWNVTSRMGSIGEQKMNATPDTCNMMRDDDDICPCAMEGMLKFLGRSWNISIIGTLGNHRQLRYGELKNKLGSISPKTLSKRLRELEDIGIVQRKAFAEIPPRVTYELTKKGMELHSKLLPLIMWSMQQEHE